MSEEKRNYLKPFRCVGGFMLFIGVFSVILSSQSIILGFLMSPVLDRINISQDFIELISAFVLTYSYYLGYRIFIKKHSIEFADLRVPPTRRIPLLIIEMLLAFAMIRVVWDLQVSILNHFGMLEEVTGDTEIRLISVLYSCLIAPVCEELVFRGWLIKVLRRYGTGVAILISSLSFGLLHETLLQSFPAMLIGFILSYFVIRYDSLIPGILLHIATNTLSTLDVYGYEEMLIRYFYPAAIIGAMLFVITHFRDIWKFIRQIPKSLDLYRYSISLIVFTLMTVAMIILN